MRPFFLLVLLTVSVFTEAQNRELWGDVTLYKNINKSFTVYGDAGSRTGITQQDFFGYYIRPSVSFKISKLVTVNGGGAWFHSNSAGNILNEIRGWQGVRLEGKIMKRVMANNFIRLEERNLSDSKDNLFLLRFRNLTGLTILLNNTSLIPKTIYLPLAFEFFEDLNDHQALVNRTRTYLGMGYVLNSKSRIELFYIANGARSNSVDAFEVVDVLRIRWHFTFPERPVLVD